MKCPRCNVEKQYSDSGFAFGNIHSPFQECDLYTLYDCEECEITFRWRRGKRLEIQPWNFEHVQDIRLQRALHNVDFPKDDDWQSIYEMM